MIVAKLKSISSGHSKSCCTYSDGQFSEQFKTEWHNYCSGITNVCVCGNYSVVNCYGNTVDSFVSMVIVVIPVSLLVVFMVMS